MSEIQQLLSQLPVDQIAQQAGVQPDEARQAIEQIVPTLVGGMQANAHDPAGAASLAGALGQHQGQLDQRLAGDVDPADGERIVQHIFGGKTDEIARAAGGGSALGEIIKKVLPIVAPIVIAWIANKYFGQGGGAQQQQPAPTDRDGGTYESPFDRGPQGGAPAPQGQTPAPQPQAPKTPQGQTPQGQTPQGQHPQGQAPQGQQEGLGLDDLLGGILGGGGSQGGQGGPLGPLGDILGGLLGGGRR